ncbi:MAG: hypothetical protein PHE67_00705 [Campylobacterales bacterium]|nr:hypothetical protein [Campylobacterales bacterium]
MEQFISQYGSYILPSIVGMVVGFMVRGILKIIAYAVVVAIIIYAYKNPEIALDKASEMAQTIKDKGFNK